MTTTGENTARPPGADGSPGPEEPSAYDLAVAAGYEGGEAELAAALGSLPGFGFVFDDSVGPAVRTNFIRQPLLSLLTDTTPSASRWTRHADLHVAALGDGWRFTATAEIPSGAALFFRASSAEIPTEPGAVWSSSWAVRVPERAPALTISPVTFWAGPNSTIAGETVVIASGATAVLRHEGVEGPEGTTAVRPYIRSAAVIPEGAVFDVLDEPMAENAATVGEAFSGSTPSTEVIAHAWVGEVNDSASTATRQ